MRRSKGQALTVRYDTVGHHIPERWMVPEDHSLARKAALLVPCAPPSRPASQPATPEPSVAAAPGAFTRP
jgi:hypothetical protein